MPSPEVGVRCPLCHARLVPTARGWRCARWAPKLGRCHFSVYRHLNSRTLSPEDLRLLCEYGAIPWPHTDGRAGWYVVDRKAPDGCRFTHEPPTATVGRNLLEPSPKSAEA